MRPLLCSVTLALCVSAGAANSTALEDVLPPILNPRIDQALGRDQPNPRPSLISDRTRKRIRDAVLRNADLLVAEPLAASAHSIVATDAVLMKPFVVESSPLRAAKLPPYQSPLLRFLKTGTIYYRPGPKFDTRLYLQIWLLQATSPDRNEEFSRYELRVNFRF